jgi:hypothetical protein
MCGRPATPCNDSWSQSGLARPYLDQVPAARRFRLDPIKQGVSPVRNAAYAITLERGWFGSRASDFKAGAVVVVVVVADV